MSELERLLRGHRSKAALGTVGLAALAAGAIVATGLPGSSDAASPSAKSSGSTSVQRRDLVATDTESGTLGYANPQTVYNRVSGTITWLPGVGTLIEPGQTLYKVDNSPVVLFDGSTPAYRELAQGISDGPDVRELNQELVNLGFDPSHQISVSDSWQDATTAAVERWQASLGQAQTGTITLGQVVFLPGAQRITSVDTVLGSTGGSGASGSGSGSGSSGSTSSGSGSSGSTSSGSTSSASGSSASSSGGATAASTSLAPTTQFVSLTKPVATAASSTASDPSSAANDPSSKTQCKNGQTNAPSTTTKRPTTTNPKCKASNSNLTLKALQALLQAEALELKQSRASAGRSGAGGAGAASGAGGGSGANAGGASGGSGGASAGGSGGGSAAASGASGSTGANAQPILATTSSQLVVTVALDATKQTEAVVDEPVGVELPDGSTVDGKITGVSPVAQASSSSSSSGSGGGGGGSSTPSATIPVTIALTGHNHIRGLDQAAVSVNFQQQKATNALSVPVTALLATAGGGYAVQEAAAPNRLLPVTPGLFAAGYVQISGPGIYERLQVTDSQG